MSQQAAATPKENKMGTMPMNRLLLSMALPIMLSMIVQALYNIVDSIYVAQISEEALTAVSLAFPIQNLMMAVATGTGVGVNALLSRNLGERKFEKANNAAKNGMFIYALSYLVFLVLGLAGSATFFQVQDKSGSLGPEIVAYGTDYLMICMAFSFGVFGQVLCERLLQSTGRAGLSMITQGAGAIINIVLDPILIFGWFGLPAMGVRGAAAATVIGQIAAFGIGIALNLKKNPELNLSLRGFRPSGQVIKRIYAVGLPSILMVSVGSVMNFLMNQILIGFTATATAVYGVFFKLNSMICMPVFGLNNAMVPILSYNYGARNRERMVQVIRLSITYAVCIMLVGMLVFLLLPRQLMMMFNASEEMMDMGVTALRIISLSFSFAGFCIVNGSVFQALGKGFLSLTASVGRQLVVLVPSAYLLAQLGNVNLVWWSYPIAEVASLALSSFFLLLVYRKVIAQIPRKDEEQTQPQKVSAAV